jgi:hypothetical protein
MEAGVLQSNGFLYWGEKPANALEKTLAHLPGAENIVLQQEGVVEMPHLPAFRCPKCRKIIFNY